MAVSRLPESGAELCSSRPCAGSRTAPAGSRSAHDGGDDRAVLRQLRGRAAADRARHRRHRRWVRRWPSSFALFHADYDNPLFSADAHLQATSSKPVAVILRPGRTPGCAEVALVLRHVVKAIRRRWPARGRPDPQRQPLRPARGHDLVPSTAGRLCLRHSPADQVPAWQQVAGACRGRGARPGRWARAERVRRFGELRLCASASWKVGRRTCRWRPRRGSASAGSRRRLVDCRPRPARALALQSVYCRPQVRARLSRRTSCTLLDRTSYQPTANQFRL